MDLRFLHFPGDMDEELYTLEATLIVEAVRNLVHNQTIDKTKSTKSIDTEEYTDAIMSLLHRTSTWNLIVRSKVSRNRLASSRLKRRTKRTKTPDNFFVTVGYVR
jgi:hypothetical protein